MTTVTGKRVILKNLQDEYLIPFTDQGGSGNPDNETIILNDEDALRAIKVMDQGQEEPYAFREVTAQEYAAMKQAGTLDPHTYYNVPDVDDIVVDVNSKANTSLDNLNEAGQAIINGKANNSLNNLNEAGQAIINGKANTSLSNLTAAGEKHFLNKTQITNCILEAPNGVATYTSNSLTVKQGLKVLFANGRNADGTLKNIEYTLPEDYTLTIGTLVDTDRTVCLVYDVNSDTVGLWTDKSDMFYMGSAYPSSITPNTNSCLYNPYTNVYSHYNGSAWVDYPAVYLGNIRTLNNTFTNAGFVNSVDILKRTDFRELSGVGMPSKNYGTVLSNPANGSTFVAPANGYFFLIYYVNNGGGWCTIRNDTNGLMTGGIGAYYVGNSGRLYLPVLKGDVVRITFDGSAPTYFRFIYAQGSESEAR